jgi:hypothetical protein
MYRRLALVLVAALLLSVLAGGLAQADSATKQVGLVIAFPSGAPHLEIVTVPVTATTFQVLQAARITLASQTGGFGPAVCGINATGCPATNCFCDPAKFWAYYHLDPAANIWMQAAEGVGAYTPANGAVEGLAWSGFDASYNPTTQPPVYTFAQIAAATAAPVLVPEPGTLALLGAGLAGLAGYVRRIRAAQLRRG